MKFYELDNYIYLVKPDWPDQAKVVLSKNCLVFSSADDDLSELARAFEIELTSVQVMNALATLESRMDYIINRGYTLSKVKVIYTALKEHFEL